MSIISPALMKRLNKLKEALTDDRDNQVPASAKELLSIANGIDTNLADYLRNTMETVKALKRSSTEALAHKERLEREALETKEYVEGFLRDIQGLADDVQRSAIAAAMREEVMYNGVKMPDGVKLPDRGKMPDGIKLPAGAWENNPIGTPVVEATSPEIEADFDSLLESYKKIQETYDTIFGAVVPLTRYKSYEALSSIDKEELKHWDPKGRRAIAFLLTQAAGSLGVHLAKMNSLNGLLTALRKGDAPK